ncbi:MAG: recombinase family protein [Peptostreptococcaceae bacterium]
MEVKVIKKMDGRVDRNTKGIMEMQRVTAYARVSTGSEDQLNSYEAQKKYYVDKIRSNPQWSYIEMYADEAISGTQDHKRSAFMKMIADGIEGKYDMIITKSISRFARNTVDTLKYVRTLKEKNVAVLFEEENINTLDMSGELLLTILSSVAQQESETISAHVKLGLKMRKERGDLIGFNNCYGYSYDSKTKKLEIVEEQADIIRYIFETYLDGYGGDYIGQKLEEMKVLSPKGFEKWSSSTILGILKNEKYKGDVLQGKTYTIDAISHKRVKNYGEEDKYYMENHHEAIIEREKFDEVQKIMESRSGGRSKGKRVGNYGQYFAMSGKLKCGFCGETYGRRTMRNMQETIPIWKCLTTARFSIRDCPDCKALRETVIKKAFADLCHILYTSQKGDLDCFVTNLKSIIKDNTNIEKIEKLQTKKYNLKHRQNNLIDLMINGKIDSSSFETKNGEFKKKIELVDKEIEQFSNLLEDEDVIEEGLNKVKNLMEKKKNFEDYDEDVFLALVDYGIIGCTDENGKHDPYIIKFMCKRNFNSTGRREIVKERVIKNKPVNNENNDVILDFISKQKFVSFDKSGEKNKKIYMQGIRVIFEIENIDEEH